MSEVLTKAEIESLIGTMTGDTAASGAGQRPAPQAAARGRSRNVVAYEVYDFRRPDKFSKEQLRTLQMLHETLGRLGGSNLSAFLRTQVSLDLVSLEQVPYEEYLRGINQSVFTLIGLPPLNGQAVLEIEFSVVFAMIDKLLGGPGRPIERSSLTEIEQPLARELVSRLCQSLKSAWEGLVVVEPVIEGIEVSAQFVQIAPPTDIVISILFEARIGEVRGALSLCVPYMVLKPVTPRLSAQKWFVNASRRVAGQARRSLANHVEKTEVQCTVVLGHTQMDVAAFRALRRGDVVRLDKKVNDRISLYVEGFGTHEGKAALDKGKVVFTVTGHMPAP